MFFAFNVIIGIYIIIFSGYANEVGEAFRSIIGSKWVTVSYGIATAYVIADTVHKTKNMHNVGIEKQGYSVLKVTVFRWQAPRKKPFLSLLIL